MSLHNCKKCGKVFINNAKELCPKCFKEEQDYYRLIKDFLWENPGANIKEINCKTNAPLKIIRKFVRENRFRRS